jgi:pimeloyl-ACP methyl ester carboxylesterase
MDFPTVDKQYTKQTYFLKGELSNYINQDNWGTCDQYFSQNKIIEIKNASHWVHADNPKEFIEKVQTILA